MDGLVEYLHCWCGLMQTPAVYHCYPGMQMGVCQEGVGVAVTGHLPPMGLFLLEV